MLVYIVHGFTNTGQEQWMKDIMEGVFKKYSEFKVVVGLVGWLFGSMSKEPLDRRVGTGIIGVGILLSFYDAFQNGLVCQNTILGGETERYKKPAANTMVIGKHLAKLNGKFKAAFAKHYCIGTTNFQLAFYISMLIKNELVLGHSLGAHTCGFFGKSYDSLDGIIGLDPAGPIFEKNQNDQKLFKTDAKFVQAIYTNAEVFGYRVSKTADALGKKY